MNMGAFSHVSSADMLMAFAYLLLLSATVPKLTHFSGFDWRMLPIWLILVAYVSSVLKNLSTKDQKEKFEKVILIALFAYFAVSIVWPFPLKWYDALLFLSLFASGAFVGKTLQAVYYLMSAASYMHDNNVLQVSGRLLIMGVLAAAIVQAHKLEKIESETT